MKTNNLEIKYYQKILLLLVPLITFGLYKNGILPFIKHLTDVKTMFLPLIILATNIIGVIIGNFINKLIIKKESKINLELLLEASFLSLIVPLNTNIYVLFILSIFLGLFKFKLNKVSLTYILLFIINNFIGSNSFINTYEQTGIASYDLFDKILGFNIGGVGTTSLFIIFIALIILSLDFVYKKEISISSIITFLVLVILYGLYKNNLLLYKDMIFIPNVMFSLTFIAPSLYSTCYTFKGKITAGVLIGLLTFILSLFIPSIGVFISILIVSLLKNIIDRIYIIK